MLNGASLIPTEPADNSQFINLHPHFQWDGPEMCVDYSPEVRIQIAEDESFINIIDEDVIGGGVNRYYSMISLLPGQSYWWRVKLENPLKNWSGEWSVIQKFTVISPDRIIRIDANFLPSQINLMLDSAVYYAKKKQTVEISFQKGNYAIYSLKEYLLDLTNVNGFRIEGNQSTFTLRDRQTFAYLKNSRNIELRNMKITHDYPGHALLTVTKLDPLSNSLEFQIHPAFPQDLDLFFSYGGFNKILSKLNTECQGRYGIQNANISTTTERTDLGNGKYRFSNIPNQNFQEWNIGDVAIATTYSGDFLKTVTSDQLVLKNLMFIDFPGAIIRGGVDTKNAYLNVSTLPDSTLKLDKYHFAGHAAVANGKIAVWAEGCSFNLLPDDNIASVGYRTWLMNQVDGRNITVRNSGWAIEPGNWLEFYDPIKMQYLGLAKVIEVKAYTDNSNLTGWSVMLDRDIGALNPAGSDYSKTTSIYSFHSNERAVFRNNRQFGGKGHGFKYYGGETALIENNYFENVAGSAIWVGKSTLSSTGFSAARITVRNNTIINCGWNSIYFPGEYNEHVRIEDNLISNPRDGSGIYIRNMKNGLIKGNEFVSLPTNDPCAYSQNILYNAIDISYFANVEITDNAFNDSRIRDTIKKGTELNGNDFPDFPDSPNLVEEIQSLNTKSIKIFPNPNDGNFKLLNSSMGGKYTINIHNELGRIIFSDKVNQEPETYVEVDLNSQPNGLYIMKITDNNNVKNIKIIKKSL